MIIENEIEILSNKYENNLLDKLDIYKSDQKIKNDELLKQYSNEFLEKCNTFFIIIERNNILDEDLNNLIIGDNNATINDFLNHNGIYLSLKNEDKRLRKDINFYSYNFKDYDDYNNFKNFILKLNLNITINIYTTLKNNNIDMNKKHSTVNTINSNNTNIKNYNFKLFEKISLIFKKLKLPFIN